MRTLRQWAESGVVSVHPRPPVRRSPHPELWHRSAEEIAMYRRQAFGLFRWRLHYYRTWEKVAKVFRRVGERLRRLSPFRPAEESAAEPAAPRRVAPRALVLPRPPGRREFVPYTGPRYAPYDPELE